MSRKRLQENVREEYYIIIMEKENVSENAKNSERDTKKEKKVWKIVLKACGWVLGVWIAVLGILQIVLSPAVLTGIVKKYAGEYVDAELSFRNIGISMFRAFPDVELKMEDCAVTYAHERFDGLIGMDMPVQFMGRGKAAAGQATTTRRRGLFQITHLRFSTAST